MADLHESDKGKTIFPWGGRGVSHTKAAPEILIEAIVSNF